MLSDRLKTLIVDNEVSNAKAEYVLSQLCPGGFEMTCLVSPHGDAVYRLRREMDDLEGIGYTWNGACYNLLAKVRATYAG